MASEVPQRIGPYTVTREIGRGGMGVVYQARDERLDRDVAIKALPEHLAADAGRLDRFEHEARVLAQLNHPNIAGILGIEEQDGRKYLVLEFVEGPTLGELLDAGPLPLADAVEYAVEIAAGLEAAHEAGVVHRDLKPDNVKIRPDGRVKVLDFGLAKSNISGSSAAGAADAATLTTPRSPTAPGAVLGTAPYMSPEQARGRSVDKRSDIWSFGVLLFEMLCGSSPFVGETASDTIGAILHKDVDLGALPPNTPGRVRHVLELCLERNRNERLHDIADARIELRRALDEPEAHSVGAATSRPAARRAVPALIGLAIGAALVGGAWFAWKPAAEPPSPPRRFDLNTDLKVSSAAISPDGRKIALSVDRAILVRDMASGSTQTIHENDESSIRGLAWSPDSDWICFGNGRALWRIKASGGKPLIITDDRQLMTTSRPWWSPDGYITFGSVDSGMLKVPISGGAPTTLIPKLDSEIHFHGGGGLPGDRGVLFVPHPIDGPATTICLGLPGGERRVLHESQAELGSPIYSPTGHILYARDSDPSGVWAIPFDLDALTVTGEPFFVIDGTEHSVSAAGDLLVLPSDDRDRREARLTWVDEQGRVLEELPLPFFGVGGIVRLSPDESQAVVTAKSNDREHAGTNNDAQLWIVDLHRHVATRLTDMDGYKVDAGWTADGESIVFSVMDTSMKPTVYRQRADGSSAPEVLFTNAAFASVSSDGSTYVMSEGPFIEFKIVTATIEDPDTRTVFQDGPSLDLFPRLRPGGGLVAYASGEPRPGGMLLFVRRFPSGPGRWQVFGRSAMPLGWSRSGDRLYFASDDDSSAEYYAVDVQIIGSDVRLGEPTRILTELTPRENSAGPFNIGIDVSSDDQRFLILAPEAQPDDGQPERTGITLIENWTALLRDLGVR